MRQKLLKAAAIVSLVFAGGHTFGTIKIAFGEAKDQLTGQTILVETFEKTFTELFLGYGYLITVLLIMQSLLLWQLSKKGADRNIIALIGITSISNAIISAIYLIFIPVIFFSLIALLLIAALYVRDKKIV